MWSTMSIMFFFQSAMHPVCFAGLECHMCSATGAGSACIDIDNETDFPKKAIDKDGKCIKTAQCCYTKEYINPAGKKHPFAKKACALIQCAGNEESTITNFSTGLVVTCKCNTTNCNHYHHKCYKPPTIQPTRPPSRTTNKPPPPPPTTTPPSTTTTPTTTASTTTPPSPPQAPTPTRPSASLTPLLAILLSIVLFAGSTLIVCCVFSYVAFVIFAKQQEKEKQRKVTESKQKLLAQRTSAESRASRRSSSRMSSAPGSRASAPGSMASAPGSRAVSVAHKASQADVGSVDSVNDEKKGSDESVRSMSQVGSDGSARSTAQQGSQQSRVSHFVPS